MSDTENTPNHPARVGQSRSLADIMMPKRPNRFGVGPEPSLPWADRNKWLRQVRNLLAECRQRHESFPHKVESVARAIAELGDVCKASLEYIAMKAGCVDNTVQASIEWLESKGALTWSHTSGKDKSGRIVRHANLYTLIMDFAGAFAVIVRTMRSLWRERQQAVAVSKRNECHGLLDPTYKEQREAQNRLAKLAKDRTASLNAKWMLRYST